VDVVENHDRLFPFLHGLDTQGVIQQELVEQVILDIPGMSIDDVISAQGTYLVEVLYEWDDGDESVGIWPGWELVEITSVEPLSLIHAHEGVYES
jgi:hypothetical protein